MKKLARFLLLLELYLVIFTSLGVVGVLLGNQLFDQSRYIALLKFNLLIVYAGIFLASLIGLCTKLFNNPPDSRS